MPWTLQNASGRAHNSKLLLPLLLQQRRKRQVLQLVQALVVVQELVPLRPLHPLALG